MFDIQVFKTAHVPLALTRLKYPIAVFLALAAIVLSACLLPNTSYAIPSSLICSVSPGINFPTPWPPTQAGSTTVASCNSRADSIAVTVDLLQWNGSAWQSINEGSNSCSGGCYSVSAFISTPVSSGQIYKTESWYNAISAGLNSSNTSYTSCWVVLDSPRRCTMLEH